MKNRLINIDLIKFLSIVLMVIDHWLLVYGKPYSTLDLLLYNLVPIGQTGFLFSSGYLMTRYFNFQKPIKYLSRAFVFALVFLAMVWLAGEKIAASGSILLNFSFSTLLALYFIFYNKKKQLYFFTAFLFLLNVLLQLLNYLNIHFLDSILANYSYPINSFTIYFLLGAIAWWNRDKIIYWFRNYIADLFFWILLILYPFIFIYGIRINIYQVYMHWPLMILVNCYMILYLLYKWEGLRLFKWMEWVIYKFSDSLFYIYFIHYIVIFGILKYLDWPKETAIWLFVISVLAGILAKELVNKVLFIKSRFK